MSNDIEFVKGLIVKAPNPKAPDFVKASLSIKRDEFLDWIGDRDGDWINVDIKEAKSGKWYAAVNAFKPEQRQERQSSATKQRQAPADSGFADDGSDIPF